MLQSKTEIRKAYLKKRRSLTHEVKKEQSIKICDCLKQTKAFRNARQILLYASTYDEVDTKLIFKLCTESGKTVFYPKVIGPGEMLFYEVTSIKQLKPGYQKIMEPAGDTPEYVNLPEDILVMPGVVFDRFGNRFGYGGGFYDRFLAAHPDIYKLALAFNEQIYQEGILPTEEFDEKVDAVISAEGVNEYE